MKKGFFYILFILTSVYLKAQINTFDILVDIVPGNSSAPYHSIEQTGDKGYIVSRASVDSSFSPYAHFNEIIKFDKTGKIIWSKQFINGKLNTPYSTAITGHPIIQTSDGNYVLGTFIYDNLQFPQPCLVKLSGAGNLIWSKVYVSNGYGVINNLMETSDNTIVGCGYTTDTSSGKTYATAFKTTADGAFIWANKSIITDSSQATFNSLTEIPGQGYAFAGTSSGSSIIVKTDLNGTVSWSKRLFNNVMHRNDHLNAILYTSDQSLLVTGGSMGGNPFLNQLVFSKLDLTGNVSWTKVVSLTGPNSDSYGSDLKERNNTYYFTAYISNPTPSTALGAITATGDVQWCKHYSNTFHTFNYEPSPFCLTQDNGFAFSVFAGTYKGAKPTFSTAIVKTDSIGKIPCDGKDFNLTLVPLTLTSLTDITTQTFTFGVKNHTPALLNKVVSESVVCKEIGEPTSIYSNMPDERIEIYPNPSTGVFNIQTAHPETNANVKIYNCLGSIIYETKIKQYTSIDLSDFPKGIYFVKFANDKGVMGTQKIIKQ